MESLVDKQTAPALLGLSWATYVRPYPGTYRSGDVAMVADVSASRKLIALIDVAGHGLAAYRYAAPIAKYLADGETSDPKEQFAHIQALLNGVSHAALFLGVLDLADASFTYLHFGDVHGKKYDQRPRFLSGQTGMVGLVKHAPKLFVENIAAREMLVLCSDGVSEKFDIDAIPNARTRDVYELARAIVDKFGRQHDDASCLVIRRGGR